MSNIGTKIIEQGSTAAGIAKVQYLDENGNVLYEVNDSDKIFKMVNGKISGLAGTGTRIVTADSTGNLSAGEQIEYGTWTPVLKGTTGVAVAGSNNVGTYKKVGKLVTFSACVHWTSITGTITGDRIIDGLPYTIKNIRCAITCGLTVPNSVVCNSNRTLNLLGELNSKSIYVGEANLQTGGTFTDTVTIGNSGTLYSISGQYMTD